MSRRSKRKRKSMAPSGHRAGRRTLVLTVGVALVVAVVGIAAFLLRNSRWYGSRSQPRLTQLDGSGLPADTWSSPETCRECHAAVYAEWADSHHAHANRLVAPAKDAEAFPGRHDLADVDEHFQFQRDGSAFVMEA